MDLVGTKIWDLLGSIFLSWCHFRVCWIWKSMLCLTNSTKVLTSKKKFFCFITLIPKVLDRHSLREFLQIYLLRSLYKLVVKVLVSRLTSMMKSIFFKCNDWIYYFNKPFDFYQRKISHGWVIGR